MKFTDRHSNREERFSLGIEETSGAFYVSFPVGNDIIEYEEYYEIGRAQFELFKRISTLHWHSSRNAATES